VVSEIPGTNGLEIVKHRGFIGLISPEDGGYVIRVMDISDYVTTNCSSIMEAQSAFEDLVDDYLETLQHLEKEI